MPQREPGRPMRSSQSGTSGPTSSEPSNVEPPLVNDACDISDILIPPDGVSLADNIKAAENAFYTNLGIGLVFPVLGATRHVSWFIGKVNTGGDWDYKKLDPEGSSKGQSKYEDFGNFNYGATAVAAGFDRGYTIQRMAGYIHEKNEIDPNNPSGNGGDHGGLDSIIEDFALGKYGGKPPFKDQRSDQRMVRRGMAYYKARCHKK